MKVSLRRAAQLQNEINARLRAVSLQTTAEINEFQDAESKLNEFINQFNSEYHVRKQLIEILFDIREQVGEKNAESGIDRRLTTIAKLDKLMALNNIVIEAEAMRSVSEINQRIDRLKAVENMYGRDRSVATGVVTESMIQAAADEHKQLKKEKQNLNDQILELNIRTEIELSDDAQEFLTQVGIL